MEQEILSLSINPNKIDAENQNIYLLHNSLEDENVNYNYEKGIYSTITIKWNDRTGVLTIGKRAGEFPGMLKTRSFNITVIEEGKSINITSQPDKEILYQGEEMNIKL